MEKSSKFMEFTLKGYAVDPCKKGILLLYADFLNRGGGFSGISTSLIIVNSTLLRKFFFSPFLNFYYVK